MHDDWFHLRMSKPRFCNLSSMVRSASSILSLTTNSCFSIQTGEKLSTCTKARAKDSYRILRCCTFLRSRYNKKVRQHWRPRSSVYTSREQAVSCNRSAAVVEK
eukprot:756779-Hanusia_phi.AAC.6